MVIDKQVILNYLANLGDEAAMRRAAGELPELIDTRRHADHLLRLGIDPVSWDSDGRPGQDGKPLPGSDPRPSTDGEAWSTPRE